jgi:ABC-type antimicrobial peptide transport system permease subunit
VLLRNLLRRKVRSALTIVGVGIGVAAMVALIAIGDGMAAQLNSMLTRADADLTVRQADVADLSFSALDESLGQRLRALPEVEQVSGFILGVASAGDLPYLLVFGYDPDEFGIRHFTITDGTRLARDRQAIIGAAAARNLKLRVGQTLKIYNTSFRLVGVYETGVPYEDGGVVITLADAQAVFKKPRQVSFYGLKLRRLEDADRVIQRIQQLYPEAFVARAAEFAETSQDIQTMRALTWALSSVAIIVGGIGVLNTMTMSVFERTREIGVLRALGWRRRRVVRMVLQEALLLSLAGGAAGLAFGVGLTQALALLPAAGSLVAASYRPALMIQALAVALVLGAVGGLYPAWRAAGLSPLEALRYE